MPDLTNPLHIAALAAILCAFVVVVGVLIMSVSKPKDGE
jgi:hypothetical protein